jgi:diguanylate cyclase (GGDEF)-like protein
VSAYLTDDRQVKSVMPKILVIEDEFPIRNTIIELLETADYEAIGAENGQKGLALAQEQIPDLIICDIMLPELDGYSILSQLQTNLSTANIPFIFLTARSDRTDFRHGMQLGADDYLTKPCTADELLEAVNSRLTKYAKITQVYQNILKQTAQQLNQSAYYDTLTKLPNRLSLHEQFKEVLESFSYQKETGSEPKSLTIPILYLNIDRFRRLNETLGFSTGDDLLLEISQRLQQQLNSQDVIARIDADEFAIILEPTQETQKVVATAQHLLNSLRLPFMLNSHELFLTASIGISLFPEHGKSLDVLLQKANKAMTVSKRKGGDHYEMFTNSLNLTSFEQLTLETDLRYAIERQQLEVYYQPQYNLATHRIIGAEALLRWNHPQRGFISPGKFIPLAEQNGLIVPLGQWMIQEACQQVKTWQNLGKSLRIAVNLSSRQFSQAELSQQLLKTLEVTDLAPQDLEVELTESLLVANPEAAVEIMHRLKTIGIKVAIDDFGTGYSSLSYLEQFPFDVLKIDQSFIRNIDQNAKNATITKAIIQMAHQLSLKVVAEGVETQTELSFLAENKCDIVQGYFFSRPLPAKDFEALIFSDS